MTPQSGLSFDQAPPILAPFRFFLAAPLFAVLAAAVLLWHGPEWLLSRWLPSVLALTHLMTLGFLGMTMMGAMFQMLPVVAGVPVARPVAIALAVFGFLAAGTLALASGFLLASPGLMRLALGLLGMGFALFVAASGYSLIRASAGATVRSMQFALIALALTVALGLVLASNYGWNWWLAERVRFTNLHLAWGLLGWVGLLVIGVSYQVVPMFQLTPAFPKRLTAWLAGSLFALLAAWSLLMLGGMEAYAPFVGALPAFGFALFAAITLRLQKQRRRKVSDVTLLFWRFGLAALLLALTLWLVGQFIPQLSDGQVYPFLLGMLFIAGFAVSVVNGMLYKIVPFLVWFHLQSLMVGTAAKVPNMKEILPEKKMRRQMGLHFAAAPLLAASTLLPPLIYPAALAFGASMLLLETNLLFAYGVYRRNVKLVS
ncbi:MAG: hypothetical protein WC091_22280 [Sulfuricellaceae bacterium]